MDYTNEKLLAALQTARSNMFDEKASEGRDLGNIMQHSDELPAMLRSLSEFCVKESMVGLSQMGMEGEELRRHAAMAGLTEAMLVVLLAGLALGRSDAALALDGLDTDEPGMYL